jgi:2-C-methyl-D-erythritol 4-phosphate cytidylyltransferase
MMKRCAAILPAGGYGTRFGTGRPKQFTLLCGRMLLVHAIQSLLQDTRVETVYVVLASGQHTELDWSQWEGRVRPLAHAGETRAETVLNALNALHSELDPQDWVLVHDAARPCLSRIALARLLDTLMDDPVGGLLAVPVADTLKRQDGTGHVLETVSRDALWGAQTPQMFRYGLLHQALRQSLSHTDESSAMEAMGHAPLLVMGEPTNIKVTYPADLPLAEWILTAREKLQEAP